MNTELYWIWLQHALGVGNDRSEAVLRTYATAKDVYDAKEYPEEWALTVVQKRRLGDKSLQKAMKEWDALQTHNAWVLTPEDDLYTVLFEGMYAPPVVLYAKGARPDVEERPLIAVVGTRHHDENGRRITRQLAAGLAAGGAILVSGGAVGLDSEALDAALGENGVCMSFQACGIDVQYPQATTPIRERLLASGGLLLTEFPLGTPAYRQNFRIRNRLISAVSDGTLVTQAPRSSGALITAGWAREQGKDVYAVPGAVGVPCCEGSNELLKDGAQLVTNAADILINYVERYPFALHFDAASAAERRALKIRPVTPTEIASAEPLTESVSKTVQVAQMKRPCVKGDPIPCPEDVDVVVRQVYDALVVSEKTVSELARALTMTPADVLSALTELELYGVVTCTAGQRYSCYDKA